MFHNKEENQFFSEEKKQAQFWRTLMELGLCYSETMLDDIF